MRHFLFILLICASVFSSRALELVNNGQGRAEIIIDREAYAGVRRAAEDLQHFIKEISGAELPLVHAPTGKVPCRIFIGETEFTRQLGYHPGSFKSSGYDILVKGNDAFLSGPVTMFARDVYDAGKAEDVRAYHKMMGARLGLFCFDSGKIGFNRLLDMDANDDAGPWYAVSALLERIGVRFYAPYEDGTVIPRLKTISLPDFRETREAAYSRREWYHSHGQDTEGIRWLKRLKNGVKNGIVYNHTTVNMMRYQENRKLHPSWFAEESPGKTFAGKYGQGGVPRYTDPDFQKICVRWLRKLLDTYPGLWGVAMGSPDGGHPWDWRDRQKYQKKGMSEMQAYANMFWDFHCALAEELKKSHPDKYLIYFSPYNYCIPNNTEPDRIPDNIIFPVRGTSPFNLVLAHDYDRVLNQCREYKKRFNPRAKGPSWEWWLSYRQTWYPRYPIFFTRTLQKMRQEFLPYTDGCFMEIPMKYHSNRMRPYNSESRKFGEMAISHLMVYVNCRLLWDPYLDMQSLLNEYYRLYFGPAEKEMKHFHEFAEEVWCRPESRSVTETAGFLKEKDVEEYFRILAEAKARTQAGSVYFRRIEAMEKGYAPLKQLFAGMKRKGPVTRAHTVPSGTRADGNLAKYRHGWLSLKDNLTAAPVTYNRTEATVAITENRKHLCIAVRCHENSMATLVAKCTLNDVQDIFNDDLVEVYVDTPERSYFKICVNPNGAIYDESTDLAIVNRDTQPVMWNPGTTAAVKKYPDRWEVEILIPTGDFGKLGPTRQYPWGINVCRTRISSRGIQNQQTMAAFPTGGAYKLQKYWGKYWMR